MIPEICFTVFVLLASGVIIFRMVSSKASKRRARNESQTSLNSQNQKIISKAQAALDAIGCQLKLSDNPRVWTKQGHHVINKSVLSFKCNVLDRLLKKSVNGADKNTINSLFDGLPKSFDTGCRDLISNVMVVEFDKNQNHIDCNAQVYGVYHLQLLEALVEYLMNKVSGEHDAGKNVERVGLIVEKMKEFEVYVDPMAKDCWLGNDKTKKKKYFECIKKVNTMFDNILSDFDKIKYNRENNYWYCESRRTEKADAAVRTGI